MVEEKEHEEEEEEEKDVSEMMLRLIAELGAYSDMFAVVMGGRR